MDFARAAAPVKVGECGALTSGLPFNPTGPVFTLGTAELAGCAQINFEDVTRMAPAVAAHPFYQIAKSQLDAVVKRLEAESV